jgi:hypothetical protein
VTFAGFLLRDEAVARPDLPVTGSSLFFSSPDGSAHALPPCRALENVPHGLPAARRMPAEILRTLALPMALWRPTLTGLNLSQNRLLELWLRHWCTANTDRLGCSMQDTAVRGSRPILTPLSRRGIPAAEPLIVTRRGDRREQQGPGSLGGLPPDAGEA